MVISVKKSVLIIFLILLLAIGFFIGINIFKPNKKISYQELIDDECTEYEILQEKKILETNSNEEKISPNCEITFKIYYSECNHIIEKKEIIDKENVNYTEEELRTKFSDWEVQKFTADEIVLYKEVADFCNEHFLLKENNGYIAIYSLDKENKTHIIENTDIAVEYLEEEDKKQIKNGIKVYTKKNLNKTIEDFE